jgi:hypothetical protein
MRERGLANVNRHAVHCFSLRFVDNPSPSEAKREVENLECFPVEQFMLIRQISVDGDTV